MSVQDLTFVGNFLLGDTKGQSDWLQVSKHLKVSLMVMELDLIMFSVQAVHSRASPCGGFVFLGLGQRLVLPSAKYEGGSKVFEPVFQQELSVLGEDDQLTSLLILPVVTAGGQSPPTSLWNCTVAGFTSDQVTLADGGRGLRGLHGFLSCCFCSSVSTQ